MRLDIHIVATEPLRTVYFINPSHQSVCLYVYPSSVCKTTTSSNISLFRCYVLARKHVPAATNTRNNNRIVRRFILYAIRVLSQECMSVCLYIPLSLLGNISVNIFPLQKRIVGAAIFYAVRLASNEIMRKFFTELLVYIVTCVCMCT
jgi:hypothetical protein